MIDGNMTPLTQTAEHAVDMSPEPILAAVDDYRGTMTDLDRGLVVEPHRFAAGRAALARRMKEAGLAAGERVIVAVGNGPLFIAAWATILELRGSPLLVHVETPPAELRRLARRFHARFAITDARDETELEDVGAAARTLTAAGWVRLAWADFGDLAYSADEPMLPLPGIPLHPTSGTTGEAKMAVRPAACALAEVAHYVQTIGIDDRDILLALAPMSHAYAHGWCVVTPMVTGADLVTMRRVSPRKVYQACIENHITILPSVASMLDTLLFGAGNRLHDPDRVVLTGGAPLSKRTASQFERIAGTRVRPLYGTTEAGAIAVARADGPMAVGGYVGPPFDGVSVQIRPLDDDRSNGDVGLVHVRSASLMAGYLVDERLETSQLADGWFNTGDLGWIDENGALHLRGRRAEVINVSGMKVLPREVEEVVGAMAGVVEVKVYPGKTRLGSPYVKAAAVVEDGVEVDHIRAHCEQHLVYYKRPARIILMNALPKSPNGKIQSDKLP